MWHGMPEATVDRGELTAAGSGKVAPGHAGPAHHQSGLVPHSVYTVLQCGLAEDFGTESPHIKLNACFTRAVQISVTSNRRRFRHLSRLDLESFHILALDSGLQCPFSLELQTKRDLWFHIRQIFLSTSSKYRTLHNFYEFKIDACRSESSTSTPEIRVFAAFPENSLSLLNRQTADDPVLPHHLLPRLANLPQHLSAASEMDQRGCGIHEYLYSLCTDSVLPHHPLPRLADLPQHLSAASEMDQTGCGYISICILSGQIQCFHTTPYLVLRIFHNTSVLHLRWIRQDVDTSVSVFSLDRSSASTPSPTSSCGSSTTPQCCI
ncbi:hypothetical protein RRG08_048046 [Elysia crispata]|uniref:Uncharacterized protein n=1 Tax=Elysia crispata TaxID=231223 RepID=A0AAE0Z4G1_9GAST|nr:hypothetical protein RRG08_048046 [Elysia crispata]